MKLTDNDVAVLRAAHNNARMTMEQSDLALLQIRAAYRAGREDMRERAAKACMEFLHDPWCCAGSIAEAIRALGVDDDA